ncbi:MAG: Rieske 2Fe-2S domain-containing protein [Dehalococcoidia bacterium]
MTIGETTASAWLPVALASELPAPGSEPVPAKLGGEALVAFRDMSGCLGALEDACAHRKIPLHFGHVDEYGLRCAVHGWTFDCAGKRSDAAAAFNPPASVRNYPVAEADGLIFSYVGSEDPAPPAPRPSSFGTAPRWIKASVDNALLEWAASPQAAAYRPQGGPRWSPWTPGAPVPADDAHRLIAMPPFGGRATVYVEAPTATQDAFGEVPLTQSRADEILAPFEEPPLRIEAADAVEDPVRIVLAALFTTPL